MSLAVDDRNRIHSTSSHLAFIPEQQSPDLRLHPFSPSSPSSPPSPSIGGSSSTVDPQGPSRLVRRNSLRHSKRISSSSLLPTNYSNKRKPSTSSTSSTTANIQSFRQRHTGPGSLYQRTLRPNVMSLRESIMARKGYWIRNVAVLIFCLTLFFFVMVPRPQPNLHSKVPVDHLAETANVVWPESIKSDHCDVAHPGRPLIQYVVMLDAGSSGSRIHAYRFNYCKATPELENELFKRIESGGLSKFADHPEDAAKSLDPLLQDVLDEIPEFLHKSTPIALKATAGLRLLGDEKSEKILAAVRNRLETKYPFPIIKEGGVSLMSGDDEGVYAWITVNYLLRRLSSLTKAPTVAVLDLGGGSTQIVFEPKVVNGHSVAQGSHRVAQTFNGNNYVLFQHSYLGYGLNEARKAINAYLIDNPIPAPAGVQLAEGEYAHPCMPVRLKSWLIHDDKNVTMIGVTDHGGDCRRVVEEIFYKHKTCSLAPCSFNGVYQPSLESAFDSDIYAFSFIFDRIAPLLGGVANPMQKMTLKDLEDLTDRVCIADETNFKEFDSQEEARQELKAVSEMCMDLSYIYGLLEFGYGIPKERELNLAKKINDYETGWCLGASIAVLEDRWYPAPA
ncbi:guanosine-diphosphatase [Entomortierella parvispora]|uniref:guanosine-diphosphatase n=1 Tax=Entomortierella parvispora TaxID=205924 RepID=A0A9P3HJP8_9FUNG|nr:guanosine-diphosphatase [Entomortierella parvispora]